MRKTIYYQPYVQVDDDGPDTGDPAVMRLGFKDNLSRPRFSGPDLFAVVSINSNHVAPALDLSIGYNAHYRTCRFVAHDVHIHATISGGVVVVFKEACLHFIHVNSDCHAVRTPNG